MIRKRDYNMGSYFLRGGTTLYEKIPASTSKFGNTKKKKKLSLRKEKIKM
jgi:hypothetical protein